MLPSEVERKLLTVLRPYGKVKKGFLKKSAAEFFFSDHWSFNKNITHTCSPEISFAAKRLSMGTVFHFFDFLFVRCIDYLSGCILRQQFWKKMNLFWDTLDSKIHDSKKVVQPKKRTTSIWNGFTITTYYNREFLQFLNRFHHCQGTANAPCPNLQWFYLRRRKRRFSRNAAQRETWIRCKSLRSGAGSFGRRRSVLRRELNCTKANQPNYIIQQKDDTFAIHLHFSMHFLEYLHVESCWINWKNEETDRQMPGSAHSEDSRNSLIAKIANLHISIKVTQATQITPPSELSRAPPWLLWSWWWWWWWWCCCCCCCSYWCIPFLASIATGPIEILLSTSISFASPSDERERQISPRCTFVEFPAFAPEWRTHHIWRRHHSHSLSAVMEIGTLKLTQNRYNHIN